MSSSKSQNQADKPPSNPNLKSSIVHKPFATGTINIFNPYRKKTSTNNSSQPTKKLSHLELEQKSDRQERNLREYDLELTDLTKEEIPEQEWNWVNILLNPWGISAIALLLSINLISAGFIWRYGRQQNNLTPTSTAVEGIGNRLLTNLTNSEFMPLNLSTLGGIKRVQDKADTSPPLIPISPALAPLNDLTSLSVFNTQYHYVLTEYTGEQSLIRAKQKVPQVSLVNFPQGVFIYLGAFKEREDAEKFIAQLKQDNLLAYIYPLD